MTPADIKALRIARGITQAELGELLDCCSDHVSRMERGARTISRKVRRKLEALTHTTTEQAND